METTWLTNSDFADYRSAWADDCRYAGRAISDRPEAGQRLFVSGGIRQDFGQRSCHQGDAAAREAAGIVAGTDATGDPLVIKGDVVVPDIGSASKVAALINQGIKPSVIDVAESDISQTQEINLIGKVA